MLFQSSKDHCEQEYMSLRDPVVQRHLELFWWMLCHRDLPAVSQGPRKGSHSATHCFVLPCRNCTYLLKIGWWIPWQGNWATWNLTHDLDQAWLGSESLSTLHTHLELQECGLLFLRIPSVVGKHCWGPAWFQVVRGSWTIEGAQKKLTCVAIEHQNLLSSGWLTRH